MRVVVVIQMSLVRGEATGKNEKSQGLFLVALDHGDSHFSSRPICTYNDKPFMFITIF